MSNNQLLVLVVNDKNWLNQMLYIDIVLYFFLAISACVIFMQMISQGIGQLLQKAKLNITLGKAKRVASNVSGKHCRWEHSLLIKLIKVYKTQLWGTCFISARKGKFSVDILTEPQVKRLYVHCLSVHMSHFQAIVKLSTTWEWCH